MRASRRLFYGAAAALALLIAAIWLWPSSAGDAVVSRAGVIAAKTAPLPRDPDGWAAAALARPLFSPERRPAKVLASSIGSSDAPMPRLSGILIFDVAGKTMRRAIFTPDPPAKPIVLAIGDSVAGNTIRAISAHKVRLSGPKGDATIAPVFDKKPLAYTPTAPIITGPYPPQPFLPQQFQQQQLQQQQFIQMQQQQQAQQQLQIQQQQQQNTPNLAQPFRPQPDPRGQ